MLKCCWASSLSGFGPWTTGRTEWPWSTRVARTFGFMCGPGVWGVLTGLGGTDGGGGVSKTTWTCRRVFELGWAAGASSKFVLVAGLGLVIADESALKQMYENKGASGKVPCLFCRNVLLKRWAPEVMDDNLTLHTCTDPSRFMRRLWRRTAASTMLRLAPCCPQMCGSISVHVF